MRLRLMVEVGKGKSLTLILGALVAGSAFADRAANREWVERNFTTHGAATNAAKAVAAAATGGLVPYSGAEADVDLGYNNLNACNVWGLMGFCCGNAQTLELSGAYYGDSFVDGNWSRYYLPWSPGYGMDPAHDFAMRSDIQGAFVPYTGAEANVDLGSNNLNACNVWAMMGFCCGDAQTMVTSGAYCGDSFADGSWNYYYLPWSPGYGMDPTRDFAMRSDIPTGVVTLDEWGNLNILGSIHAYSGVFASYYVNVSNGSVSTDYQADCVYPGEFGAYYFPWSPNYGGDPLHDFAMRSDVQAATVTAERIVELVQSMDAAQKAALRTALGIE